MRHKDKLWGMRKFAWKLRAFAGKPEDAYLKASQGWITQGVVSEEMLTQFKEKVKQFGFYGAIHHFTQ